MAAASPSFGEFVLVVEKEQMVLKVQAVRGAVAHGICARLIHLP
jgi:hypothetical protein